MSQIVARQQKDPTPLTPTAELEETEWIAKPWIPVVTSLYGAVSIIALGAAAAVAVGRAGGYGPISVVVQASLAVLLAMLTVIDIAIQRLPDALVLPAYPIAISGLAWAAAAGEISWTQLGTALICGLGLSLAFYLLALLTGGMGWGDVKLVGLIGLILGISGVGNALAGGFLLPTLCCTPVVFTALLFGKGHNGVAFGPLLALGAVLAMVFHTSISTEAQFIWAGLAS